MKVTFNIDSGANVYSCKSVTFDLNTEKGQKQLGFTKKQWLELKEHEKQKYCEDWANNYLEIYFEERAE